MRTQAGAIGLASSGLGDTQRGILERIKRGGPRSAGDLADALGLASETIRNHLNALVGRRLAARVGTRRRGPGRPEILYGLTAEAESLFPNEEGQLLRDLAAYLTSEGREDVLEAFFAARVARQGREAGGRVRGLRGRERLEEVAAILTEEGFLAEVVDDEDGEAPRLRLCHCPLKEIVKVSTLPCRAEIAWVEDLLGARLARRSWMPSGDRTCTYGIAAAPGGST